MARLITVIGATGLQGSSVIDSLIKEGAFSVRGITRNLNSPGAKLLRSKGVQLRAADLSDYSSLTEAFEGSYGVFVVTDTHSCKGDLAMELQQGKNASEAAKQAGIQHLVFSSMEDPELTNVGNMPDTQPGVKLGVFEVKHAISMYIKANGPPATHLIPSAYYENYLRWYRFQKLADGYFALSTNVGYSPFAQNAVADIGESAAAVFKRGMELFDKSVPVVSESLSMPAVLAIIGEVTGKNIVYRFIPDEAIRSLPFSWAKEVANMYQYFREGIYQAVRQQDTLVVSGIPFRQWAEANKEGLLKRLNEATDSDMPFNAGH